MCNERLCKTKQYNELYEIVKRENDNNFQSKEDKQFYYGMKRLLYIM